MPYESTPSLRSWSGGGRRFESARGLRGNPCPLPTFPSKTAARAQPAQQVWEHVLGTCLGPTPREPGCPVHIFDREVRGLSSRRRASSVGLPVPGGVFVLVVGVRRHPPRARAGRPVWSGRALEELEILVLRHELSIVRRQVARPPLSPVDRLLFVALNRLLSRHAWPAFIVRPETLLCSHRRPVAPSRAGSARSRANAASGS